MSEAITNAVLVDVESNPGKKRNRCAMHLLPELCANCRGVQARERISEFELIDRLRPASEMPGSYERTDNVEYSAVDKVNKCYKHSNTLCKRSHL